MTKKISEHFSQPSVFGTLGLRPDEMITSSKSTFIKSEEQSFQNHHTLREINSIIPFGQNRKHKSGFGKSLKTKLRPLCMISNVDFDRDSYKAGKC